MTPERCVFGRYPLIRGGVKFDPQEVLERSKGPTVERMHPTVGRMILLY